MTIFMIKNLSKETETGNILMRIELRKAIVVVISFAWGGATTKPFVSGVMMRNHFCQ